MRIWLSIALCMVPGTSLAQNLAVAPVLSPGATLLSVTAEGQSRRTPDLALFSAGVVTTGSNAAEALSANATRMDRVIAALKRAGIEARDLQTSAVSLQPRYSDPEREAQIRARETRQPYVPPAPTEAPKIIGYEARNSLNIRVRRLPEMGRIIDALVAEGANQIDGPNFTVDAQREALDEARTEAIANARARAELYARAAGLRVARILSISESGGFYPVNQIVVTGRMAAGAPPPPPPTPIAPGELALGVSLSVQFELAR
ncbi:SIMPL domain-containing protein [Sphingomonas sp. ID1715]|uniref:SIMPL domain-containing protein n=1 Tax=Sphingomonas sp. ID1715 TaxID=1656898 RepID=UPI001487FBCF|nr:SIMPL domain-containing protein [Sphingomonas sp. ID1715]NNM76269.1 SIMPL domain-containing protein [Sphingomonas sp. ID1715]